MTEKNQLTLLVTSGALLCILVISSLELFIVMAESRHELADRGRSIADGIAAASSPEIRTGIPRIAAFIRNMPEIRTVEVLDQLGKKVYRYPPGLNGAGDRGMTGLFNGRVRVNRVIYRGDKVIGHIYMTLSAPADTEKLTTRLLTFSAAGSVLLVLLFFITRRHISWLFEPVASFSNAVKEVAVKENYAARAGVHYTGELGTLCREFNGMVLGLQKREMDHLKSSRNLRRSEKKFRSIIEESSDPIFIMSGGKFVYANPPFLERFEYSAVELSEKSLSLFDILTEQSLESILGLFKKSPQGETLIGRRDIVGISKTGKHYDFELGLSLVNWENDHALLGTMRDITARKKTLEELKGKQEELGRVRHYLQNIVDSMPSLLAGIDRDGRITEWNKEAARVTGISRDESLGRYIHDVLPFLYGQMEHVTRAIVTKEPKKTERLMYSFNGETRFNDITIYPLITDGVEGAVIRIDDVTSRVQLETMMVQSEKMISVGSLAAGMAHEINNPLGAILMSAQNLNRRISPDFERNREAAIASGTTLESIRIYMEKRGLLRMMDGIMVMGERASKIVNNMLSFSRRSETEKIPVDIEELVDRTLELAANDYDLKRRYDFKHIRILRKYEKLPPVWCIPTEIEQVILNLVKNAAQAMLEGTIDETTPSLTIRINEIEGQARIEIQDNGPGINKEIVKRIFEPFFTTKNVGLGTGLGLSVSYFIITDNHNGRLEVITAPGEGANFIISIPIDGGRG